MPETQETESVEQWAERQNWQDIHIDCVTTVMLKILDGKCKMFPEEKETIARIYDVIKDQPGKLLDQTLHELIHLARKGMDDEMVEKIYEQRLYAETMIGRPTMKAFKAMLRQQGIIG